MLVTLAVVLWPVAETVWMSLHNFILFKPRNVPFIGLGNFWRLLHDEVFWLSLGHSLVWISLVVGLQVLLGPVCRLLGTPQILALGVTVSILEVHNEASVPVG